MKQLIILILITYITPMPAWSASKNIQFKPAEKPSSYVRQMKDSSGDKVSRPELQTYINSLLKANAIYDRTQSIEQPKLHFTVRANKAGDLVVSRKQKNIEGVVINNHPLKVYGVGYSLESGCSQSEQRCWVFYPGQNTRWVEIGYAPRAINELVAGLGLLIKEMQR